MNILTIDTSTEIELIALSVDGKIYQYSNYTKMSHSITMFDNLSSLLSEASIKIDEIDLIGTGIGPGSFTGIRIAVSTARMFAQILRIPLVGIKSQEIYAASVQGFDNHTILAAFDAKKSKVFAGVYSLKGSDPHEIIEPGDYYMDEILESTINHNDIRYIKEVEGAVNLVCIGDGCKKYMDVIDNLSKENGFFYTNIINFIPNGKAATELTISKYNESPKKYINFENTLPFYARKSDAEISKSSK